MTSVCVKVCVWQEEGDTAQDFHMESCICKEMQGRFINPEIYSVNSATNMYDFATFDDSWRLANTPFDRLNQCLPNFFPCDPLFRGYKP